MLLTESQVLELAPDAASAGTGRQQANVRLWNELGQSPDAFWGMCQGSALYQVRVDRQNLGTGCSCPSRKFPCKHALGLLLLVARDPASVPEDEPPDWVADWIEKRRSRQAAEPVAAARKPVDEKARDKRQSARSAKVDAGLERLDAWLKDLVRTGLAGIERRPRSFWDEQAKRLVDAQAAGLARQVSRLADIPGRGPHWPAVLLQELGRLKLLIHACQRSDQLPAPLLHDVRQIVGWTVSAQELESEGEHVEDEWMVFGQWVDDDDERFRTQRSWAIGRDSGRMALILQFAPGIQPFAESIVVGTQQRATLLFYPGASAQRAKFQARQGEPVPIAARLPGVERIEALLEQRSDRLAAQPWQFSFGCVLHDVTLTIEGERWFVRDGAGDALPLAGREHWKLLAITGGHPFDIMGECMGESLQSLSIRHRGEFRTLNG